MKRLSLLFQNLLLALFVRAEDGYSLWLRYQPIDNVQLLSRYRKVLQNLVVYGSSETITIAKAEHLRGLQGLLGCKPGLQKGGSGTIRLGVPTNSPAIAALVPKRNLRSFGNDAFLMESPSGIDGFIITIAGNTDMGVLYGTFHFLRLPQTHKDIEHLNNL